MVKLLTVQKYILRRLLYDTAPSKEQVLVYWNSLYKLSPVDWNNKDKVKEFRLSLDLYSKSWSKLRYDEQGWVCEKINDYFSLCKVEE